MILTPAEIFQTLFPDAPMPDAIRKLQNFSEFSTDSRTLRPGALFIAIEGEKHDGHLSIPSAIEKGATGILLKKEVFTTHYQNQHSPHPVQFFPVLDTTDAFRKLATAARRKWNGPVVVVAGSVGKTTTKEMIDALLSAKFKNRVKTQGSQNGFLGIPLTLSQLTAQTEVAVIEVGIDAVGAMKQHMDCVQPQTSIVTTITPEHMEFLKDLPTVAREEGLALSEVAHSGGTVIINCDDPWLAPYFQSNPPARAYGFTLDAQFPATPFLLRGKIDPATHTLHAQMQLHPKNSPLAEPVEMSLPLPLWGEHHARNLLGACTVALSLGLTPQEIQAGLKNFAPPEGRAAVKSIGPHLQVICDYYNASPASMQAGFEVLHTLHQQHRPSRAMVALADMLELGEHELKYHRDLAPGLLSGALDAVFLLGPRMKSLQVELQSQSPQTQVLHFEDHDSLFAALSTRLQSQPHLTTYLLLKGSRSMKMEKIWNALLQNQGRMEGASP